MNSLSWFLYLAVVVGNIAVLSAIAAGIMFLIFAYTMDYPKEEPHPLCKKGFPRLGVLCVIAAILAALIPSQQTMYLIAASEIGDKVYHSQTGQKAVAALDRHLDTIGIQKPTDK